MVQRDIEGYREDARLIARSRQGDHAAFRQLFEIHSPLVYRIAYRMLGSPDDAADLTQDVFVRAYERLHTIKDNQAFHAWITRLVINMAHDRLRRRRPTPLSLDTSPSGNDDGGEWQLADDAPDQETRVISAERAQRVQQALMSLSQEHRIVAVLHHMEGMALEEIARIVAIPVGTVKSRLARARTELKRKLEGFFDE